MNIWGNIFYKSYIKFLYFIYRIDVTSRNFTTCEYKNQGNVINVYVFYSYIKYYF